jgi:hypothetical protein
MKKQTFNFPVSDMHRLQSVHFKPRQRARRSMQRPMDIQDRVLFGLCFAIVCFLAFATLKGWIQ